jgi:hypothetical protein
MQNLMKVRRSGDQESFTNVIEGLKNFRRMLRHFTSLLVNYLSPESRGQYLLQAASNAGVSLKMLVKGVFQFEVQLDNWLLAERKKALLEDEQRRLME